MISNEETSLEIETNILSSLTLAAKKEERSNDEKDQVLCLRCDKYFDFPDSKDDYLGHLFMEHRLVISEIEDIADLKGYLEYWRPRFQGHPLEEFCVSMLQDILPDGSRSKDELYYIIDDILPEDMDLRSKLRANRLEKALVQHQFELTDRNFCRECLYCRSEIAGLRSEFIEHLFNKHFLQLGKAENLVFIDELIDVIQNKLDNLICLFCEKLFKDRATLKEHMRKKGHKRINPDIKSFDKYFLINYKLEKLKVRNKRKSIQNTNRAGLLRSRFSQNVGSYAEPDESDIEIESDWSDWDGEKQTLTCLFCAATDNDFVQLRGHMVAEHDFDFESLVSPLSFYQKVKIVNYIRRQMHILRCVTCNMRFESSSDLLSHLNDSEHFSIGEKRQWDHPEFFFPTYEDDGVLCHLDDGNEITSQENGVVVLSEDCSASTNKDAEELSLEYFIF